jgi:hypothetical protein
MRSPLGYKKKGHSTNNTKKNARLSVTSRSIKMQQDEKCFAQVTTRMEMTGNYFTPAQHSSSNATWFSGFPEPFGFHLIKCIHHVINLRDDVTFEASAASCADSSAALCKKLKVGLRDEPATLCLVLTCGTAMNNVALAIAPDRPINEASMSISTTAVI